MLKLVSDLHTHPVTSASTYMYYMHVCTYKHTIMTTKFQEYFRSGYLDFNRTYKIPLASLNLVV